MKPQDVLDTVGQLDYTYESLPVRAGLAVQPGAKGGACGARQEAPADADRVQ